MPEQVLAEADRLARELGRSRSWIVAEAIRQLGRSLAPQAGAHGLLPRDAPVGSGRLPENSGERWELLACFERTDDYLAWRGMAGNPAAAGDPAAPARICDRLDHERASYVEVPLPELPDRRGGELALQVDPAPDNLRRVLRGLASAGYRFASEELAETVAGHAVTVIGTRPTVAILTRRNVP